MDSHDSPEAPEDPHLNSLKDSSFLDRYLHSRCLVHNEPYLFAESTSTSNKKHQLLCAKCTKRENSQLFHLGKSSVSFTETKCDYLREQSPNLSHLLAELREEEQSLGSRMICLSESKSQALSDLRQRFQDLRKALSAREEALERELEEVYKCCLFELEDGRECSKIWQGQLSVLLGCVAELERVKPSFHRREKRATVERLEKAKEEDTDVNDVIVDGNKPKPSFVESLSNLPRSADNKVVDHEPETSGLRKRPVSSEESDFAIDSDLVAKICLLEDAVRNAITSLSSSDSPLNYYSTSADQVSFNFDGSGQEADGPSDLESVLSVFGAVASSSSEVVPVDWSVNNIQQILTTSKPGTGHLCRVSDSKIIYAERYYEENRLVSIEKVLDEPLELKVSFMVSDDPNDICPCGMCLYRGYIYFGDSLQNSIQIWREKDASFVGSFGSKGTADGQFHLPWDCLVYEDELYVLDTHNHRIQVLSLPHGKFLRKFGSLGRSKMNVLQQPMSFQVYQDQLFVAEHLGNRVSVFNPSTGAFLFHIEPRLSPSDSLKYPSCILIQKGVLFVALSNRIVVLTCEGEYLYSFFKSKSNYDIQGMVILNNQLFVNEVCQLEIHVFEQK